MIPLLKHYETHIFNIYVKIKVCIKIINISIRKILLNIMISYTQFKKIFILILNKLY